jgi:uncharacterized damage-inducible protein DinB
MTGRGLLLAELERVARNCCTLLRTVNPDDFGFQPQDNMRKLIEVANCLAQIPLVDLRIISGAKEKEIQDFEAELWSEDAEDWCAMLREGYAESRQYFETLTFDNYENGSATAFYGRTQTNAKWLLEMIAHLYHDRAQLFLYLKLLDYPVDSRALSS